MSGGKPYKSIVTSKKTIHCFWLRSGKTWNLPTLTLLRALSTAFWKSLLDNLYLTAMLLFVTIFRGHRKFQKLLARRMRTTFQLLKQVRNRSDSSAFLDGRQIKEYRSGWQSLLPRPPSLQGKETLLAGYQLYGFRTNLERKCALWATWVEVS